MTAPADYGHTMTTGRLEAFSDGVFAIAITLLIIEVHPPEPSDHLLRDLLEQWPSYVAYAVSFLIIGVIWLNHHTMFHYIVRCDRWLLVLNLFLLLSVAFLPFPTAVIAEAENAGEGQRVAAVLYGATLVVGGVFFNALWFYASSRHRLLGDHITPAEATVIRRRFGVGPLLYLVGTLVGFISARLSLGVFALLLVTYLLDARPRSARKPELAKEKT